MRLISYYKIFLLKRIALFIYLVLVILYPGASCNKDEDESASGFLRIESFVLDPVFPRAEKKSMLKLVIRNLGENLGSGKIQLILPETITWFEKDENEVPFSEWKTLDTKKVQFNLISHSSVPEKIAVKISGQSFVSEPVTVKWNPAVSLPLSGYAPEPVPVNTGNFLVGAQRADLWNVPGVWDLYRPTHIERQPVIGWYNEGESDVTDWEIKYAAEHGISFFMHCWYRDKLNVGKVPVQPQYDHVIKSYSSCRYADKIKFAIEWINSYAGVSGTDDLLKNIVPFWIENYFKKANYLKIDNKPVVIIYAPDKLIEELGGVSNTASTITVMRQACVNAGFDGLILIGQYCWGPSKNPNAQFKSIGLEYSSAYHWPTFGQVLSGSESYTGQEIIDGHQVCWQDQANFGSLPNIITCSMGWDSTPWGGMHSKSKWRLTPDQFQTVLQNAKNMMANRTAGSLDSRILLLDNWNEYGEGHYIFPARQYGFGYLDAIRNVFSSGDKAHTDIVPEDIGLSLNKN